MQNNVVLIPTHLIQSLLAFAKAHAHSADTLDQEGAEAAGTGPTPSRTPVGNAIPEVEALLAASKGGFADVAAVACLSTCHITAETNGMLELAGDRNPWFYGQYESGYWIWVPQEDPITGHLRIRAGGARRHPIDLVVGTRARLFLAPFGC